MEIRENSPETFGEPLPIQQRGCGCGNCGCGGTSNDALFTTTEGMSYVDFGLLAPAPKAGDRPAVKRVLSGAGANLILATFLPGQALRDHTAAYPITVQCLSGQLTFTCGSDKVLLNPGQAVNLPAKVVHRVDCVENEITQQIPSLMLLTMITGA